VDPLLAGIELSEWRLVGPGLAALIVALALRFRLSRARIQEFLAEWLGLELSIARSTRRSTKPAPRWPRRKTNWSGRSWESDLLHADETPWPEARQTLWLWVFVATTATVYSVAGRGKERVENVLDGFTGWLMSDGWGSYRHYARRLRCGAHLIRKARGLARAATARRARLAGLVLDTLEALMAAVYAAREGPPPVDLPTQHASLLAALRATCEQGQGSTHAENPCPGGGVAQRLGGHLPSPEPSRAAADNNAAERALRHWVILRKLSLGTRTPVGSRVVALLASVIDTCRQRGHSPLAHSRTRHRRPPRRPAPRSPATAGG